MAVKRIRRKPRKGFTHGGKRAGAGHPTDPVKRKHVSHLADYIRTIMREALEENATSTRPLKLVLVREMRRQPLKFLEVLSKFLPKDLNVKVERNIFDELDDTELDGLLEEARELAAARADPVEAPRGKRVRSVHSVH